MAHTVNIWANDGANIISDTTTPALTLFNSGASSNAGAEIRGLVGVSTASIDLINTPAIQSSVAGGGVLITKTVVGNMTIGILRLSGNSIASGSMIDVVGTTGFVSITSVVLTSVANTDYAIRVTVNGQARWIPLFKDAGIIGAAAA